MTKQTGCSFCDRLVDSKGDQVWDKRVIDDGSFFAVPTKGSIVPGWLLVVSTEHHLCAGSLEASELGSLLAAVDKTRRIVESVYGPVTVFEHGPVSAGSALGCGVDHLHIHLAPLEFSLTAVFSEMFPATNWVEADGWSRLSALHDGGRGYVAVEERGTLRYAIAPLGVRQPLRRAVAAGVGAAETFDYNTHPYTEHVQTTLSDLAAV